MDKVWKIKKRIFDDPIKQLLYNRSIITQKGEVDLIERFIEPSFDNDLHDPELLPNWKEFKNRLTEAVDKQETIGIFADYDADGIPGAAYLYRALVKLGVKARVYIPTREEGYGLNKAGIDVLVGQNCSLIITVDLGIRSFEMVEYAASLTDIIITDHHLPDDKLPKKALAVVNPKVSGSKYPFKELSGAGVVFKLVSGLAKFYPEVLTEAFLKWNLDLIAISTISDVVPLVDENRVITKFGLISLIKTHNIGLKKLYQVAAIDAKKINTYTVGFQIAPRINAPGRIDHASKSFELLVTEDENEAVELAHWLNKKNALRQNSMDQVEQECIAQVIDNNLDKDKIIIVHGDWPKGVIGPSASRLVEKFRRPVIILSKEESGYSGSSRSIPNFNIIDGLKKVEKYLKVYGGHKGAAGLQLEKTNLTKFITEMVKIANNEIKDEHLKPAVDIDLEISPGEISVNQFKKFFQLEPFGLGNPRPIFYLKNVKIIDHRFVGKDNKHLKLMVSTKGQDFEAIFFGCNIDLKKINLHNAELLFSPEINYWNGQNKVSLNIIDIRDYVEAR